jgi:hypothetical protein
MLDSPERGCAGQAWFEYPATFVLFSKCSPDRSTLLAQGSLYSGDRAIVQKHWSKRIW